MYTSGGEVILGHFLCLDVENMGLDDISWRRLHFLETWLEYGSEADCYLNNLKPPAPKLPDTPPR